MGDAAARVAAGGMLATGSPMANKPLGERNYEVFADRYAKYARDKPHNAHYERPATLSLLPDVDGQRILDAGCGPGFYSHELLERGADVVAIDVTPRMVELTAELVGQRASVHVHDLGQPLVFAEDQSFDGIVSPLTLDYIEDWEPVFAEFHRVLRPGGWLVYSHSHPTSDYQLVQRKVNADCHYFARERFAMPWSGFGKPFPTVAAFRRPLAQMLNAPAGAGLVIDQVLEPLPTEAVRRINPDLHAALSREPVFLCIRVRKPA